MAMVRQITDDALCIVKGNGEVVMRMEEKLESDVCHVFLSGVVNADIACEVCDELDALMSVGKGVELRLGGVTHLSGTFEEKLILLQQKMEMTPHKTLPIRDVPHAIYDELVEKGIAYSLDIRAEEA